MDPVRPAPREGAPHYLGWRTPIALFSLTLLGATTAQADLVRITSINGNYDPNRPDSVDVRPGDVVQLSADVFTVDASGSNYDPQNRPLEDFIWSSDARAQDACDPQQAQDCLAQSHFEVTDYGVNFYVPTDAGQQITLSVQYRGAGQEPGSYDQITLRNTAFVEIPQYTPPTEIVTDPEQYNYDQFDSTYALAGQGNWVTISGSRYWVPNHYKPDWYPYQNGYWTWTDTGWTWVSYDPWGWYTDHYGVWRRHRSYGWIWHPYHDRVWRPHAVTWLYGDGYIGWYPYNDGYRQGYRHGYADGFVDGYWEGYRAGQMYGRAGYSHWIPGYSFVSYTHFGHVSIFDVLIRDARRGWGYWNHAWSNYGYGAWPGGTAYGPSRVWVESRCGYSVSYTRVSTRVIGGFTVHYPARVHAVPPAYSTVRGPTYRDFALRQPISVGSIVRADAGLGTPVVTRPLLGGRGIGVAPALVDRATGLPTAVLPRRASTPSIVSPEHRIVAPFPSRSVPGGTAPVTTLPEVRAPRFTPSAPISIPRGTPPVALPPRGATPVSPGSPVVPPWSSTPGVRPGVTPPVAPVQPPRFEGGGRPSVPGVGPGVGSPVAPIQPPRFGGGASPVAPVQPPRFGGGAGPVAPVQPPRVTPPVAPIQPPRFGGGTGPVAPVQPPRVTPPVAPVQPPRFGGGGSPVAPVQPPRVAPVQPPRFGGGGSGPIAPVQPPRAPSMPVQPPRAPSMPVQPPRAPSMPVQPPRAPSMPVQPPRVSAPVAPRMPSMPSQPPRVSAPVAPRMPSMPSQPQRVSAPVAPRMPSMPSQPPRVSAPVAPRVSAPVAPRVSAPIAPRGGGSAPVAPRIGGGGRFPR
jgi:hypothetical protein